MIRPLLLLPLLLAAAPAAAQSPIRPGETVTGELDAADPTMFDGAHYEVWHFEGTAAHRYRVTLRSTDFDAFLLVGADARPGCDDCATDDDGAGGTDAQVEYVGGQDGTYEIRAFTFRRGDTGRYQLSLEDAGVDEAPPPIVGTPIGLGEAGGELSEGDEHIAGHSYIDTWTYTGRAGETITITLRSADFDAVLAVGAFDGGECTAVDEDDNSGGGTDGRVTLTLSADGPYHLHVSSAQADGSGRYTLLVEQAERVVAVASPIEPGTTVEGQLLDGDAWENDGSRYDLWSFRGRAGERVTITLRSEDFDAFLRFGRGRGEEWEQIANDDDGAGGSDSRITVTLPEDGEYLVYANTFGSGERGSYTLRVDRD
jgi:Bacterial pre-peptidase C-terminal domain